jgi:hypothetical protein
MKDVPLLKLRRLFSSGLTLFSRFHADNYPVPCTMESVDGKTAAFQKVDLSKYLILRYLQISSFIADV